MRRAPAAVSAVAVLLAFGCASTPDPSTEEPAEGQSPAVHPSSVPAAPARSRLNVASGLIFDHRPGAYSAESFTWRSEWPSTEAYYTPGQVIFFREHFRDVQGPGFNRFDHTYRRFDTRRVGVAFK